MHILLKAFVDTNFGDNFFIHIITTRYAQHTFYLLIEKEYEEAYYRLTTYTKNLRLLETIDAKQLAQMDAMWVVGGDMFWDQADYNCLIRQTRAIRQAGGTVAFLGLSLFREYSLPTKRDLKTLFAQADLIVVREPESFQQMKRLVPWQKVVSAADIAFAAEGLSLSNIDVENGVLGMSVRKKIEACDNNYARYCHSVAETVMEYLSRNSNHRVRLLALSAGVYNDTYVAEDVIQLCEPAYRERVECITFDGNVLEYMKQIQRCESLLCTRFHALVCAILLAKPFVPIVYEEKMDRLLNAIGYHGMRLRYEQEWAPAAVLRELDSAVSNGCFCVTEEQGKQAQEYMDRGKMFFDCVDRCLYVPGTALGRDIKAEILYMVHVIRDFLLNKLYRKHVCTFIQTLRNK